MQCKNLKINSFTHFQYPKKHHLTSEPHFNFKTLHNKTCAVGTTGMLQPDSSKEQTVADMGHSSISQSQTCSAGISTTTFPQTANSITGKKTKKNSSIKNLAI
jgi:hypothetical protein